MMGSIFLESWWVAAATQGEAQTAVYEKNGECLARLNYVIARKRGLTRLSTPQLTQFSGMWLKPKDAKYAKVLSYQKECIEGVVAALPPHDIASFNLDPSLFNGLPFYWHGFDLSVGYTYVLEAALSEEQVWSICLENIRREIRKADKRVNVTFDQPLSILLGLVDETFKRQGKAKNYSNDTVLRLDEAVVANANRTVLVAKDDSGALHAAAYLVWDGNAMHYLIGGGDPSLRNSGAASLLLWEAIRLSRQLGLDFNFEGSMIKGVEKFFRGFGATQIPYLRVTRQSRKATLFNHFRGIAKLGTR